jgi:hypothetical protein
MKNTSILLTTALASLITLAPAVTTSADAAGIKIRPQVVKVKPKIVVAKPRVRIKVKAARVRVKPKLRVKVKPKIAIAKPKVRIKVKAATAKLKPKIKPQVKLTRVKPKPAVKIKPAALAGLKVKPRLKPRIAAKKITSVKPALRIDNAKVSPGQGLSGRQFKLPAKGKPSSPFPGYQHNQRDHVPSTRPVTITVPKAPAKALAKRKPRYTVEKSNKAKTSVTIKSRTKSGSAPTNYDIGYTGAAAITSAFSQQESIKDAAQAARAAAAVKDAIKVNVPGVTNIGSNGEGIANFDVGVTAPRSNNEILQSMFRTPAGGGTGQSDYNDLWGSNGLGNFNADNFVGLPSTHTPSGTNPNTAAGGAMAYWGKKRDSDIAGAIAGVAGDRTSSYRDGAVTVTKTVHDDGQVTQTKTENIYRGGEPANGQIGQLETTHRSGVEDPTTMTTDTGTVTGFNGYSRHWESGSGWRSTDETSNPHGSRWELGHNHRDPFERYPSEKTNPDYAGGGSSPFPWINEREKGTFDFSKVGSGGKTPGALTQAPHGEDSLTTGSPAMLTQNDVLERYDEDGRNRGQRTPIDRSRIQSD